MNQTVTQVWFNKNKLCTLSARCLCTQSLHLDTTAQTLGINVAHEIFEHGGLNLIVQKSTMCHTSQNSKATAWDCAALHHSCNVGFWSFEPNWHDACMGHVLSWWCFLAWLRSRLGHPRTSLPPTRTCAVLQPSTFPMPLGASSCNWPRNGLRHVIQVLVHSLSILISGYHFIWPPQVTGNETRLFCLQKLLQQTTAYKVSKAAQDRPDGPSMTWVLTVLQHRSHV